MWQRAIRKCCRRTGVQLERVYANYAVRGFEHMRLCGHAVGLDGHERSNVEVVPDARAFSPGRMDAVQGPDRRPKLADTGAGRSLSTRLAPAILLADASDGAFWKRTRTRCTPRNWPMQGDSSKTGTEDNR